MDSSGKWPIYSWLVVWTHILVHWDDYSKYIGEKKCSKPPRMCINTYIYICTHMLHVWNMNPNFGPSKKPSKSSATEASQPWWPRVASWPMESKGFMTCVWDFDVFLYRKWSIYVFFMFLLLCLWFFSGINSTNHQESGMPSGKLKEFAKWKWNCSRWLTYWTWSSSSSLHQQPGGHFIAHSEISSLCTISWNKNDALYTANLGYDAEHLSLYPCVWQKQRRKELYSTHIGMWPFGGNNKRCWLLRICPHH